MSVFQSYAANPKTQLRTTHRTADIASVLRGAAPVEDSGSSSDEEELLPLPLPLPLVEELFDAPEELWPAEVEDVVEFEAEEAEAVPAVEFYSRCQYAMLPRLSMYCSRKTRK